MPNPDFANNRLKKNKELKDKFSPKPAVSSISRHYFVNGLGCEARELVERLSLILEELAAEIRAGGGFIGHIKALVSVPDGPALGLSVVKDRVHHQNQDFNFQTLVSDFKVAVTAIVYGFNENELTRLTELGLASRLASDFCSQATQATINMLSSGSGASPKTRT